MPGSINLDFETLVPWSLGGLTKDFSDWIQQDQEISEISKTGVLSSPRFQKLLARTIGEELSHSLALLVCITSIIFNKGQHTSYIRFPSKDLRIIRARAAKGVLQHLEKALKPAALEKAARSRAQLEALFMLVFGTIIAAGYFQEWKEVNTPLHAGFRPMLLIEFSLLSHLKKQRSSKTHKSNLCVFWHIT